MDRQMKQTDQTVFPLRGLCGAAVVLTLMATLSAGAQPDLKRGMGAEKEKADNAQKEALQARRVLPFGLKPGMAKGAFSEQQLIASLQAQGITDDATVKPIAEHMERVAKVRQVLDEKSEALRANLKPNTVVADAQMNVLINDYQAAAEDYKTAREKSAKQLDDKIGYSKRPRLYAVLLTMGIVGDGPQNDGRNGNGMRVFERFNNAVGPLIMRWNDANGANGELNFEGGHFQGNEGLPLGRDPFAVPGFPNADIIVNNALRAVQPPPLAANPAFGQPFGNAMRGPAFGQPFGAFQAHKEQVEAMNRDLEALKAQVNELNEEMKRLKAAQEKPQDKAVEK
ncbi:MAG TPA: hypothetical protein VGB77_08955 [Abditibacteriaceae bacterium]|jgi:hypothetical protein